MENREKSKETPGTLFEQFKRETEGKTKDEIIKIFEEKYAFKYGAPGTYLTDLNKHEK